MHALRSAAGLAVLLAGVTGCSSDPLPSFVGSSPDRIGLRCGSHGPATASPARDNLYELLGLLHLGGLTRADRTSTRPGPAACTAVFYGRHRVWLSVLIPAKAQASQVYIEDEAHPADSGTYPLQQPIQMADLHAFLRKYSSP